jgi:4-hydroxymandelate oxidase
MTSPIVRATSRRRFLQYLAGSPLLASGALQAYGMEAPVQTARSDDMGAAR